MNLTQQDDIPVYERPRRLSSSDKVEVDNQIKTWPENGIVVRKFQVVRRRTISHQETQEGDSVQDERFDGNFKRTQASAGFHPRFLRQYYVVLLNDRYTMQREGEYEEPQTTSTAVDYTKLWVIDEDSAISETSDGEHIWGQTFISQWPSVV